MFIFFKLNQRHPFFQKQSAFWNLSQYLTWRSKLQDIWILISISTRYNESNYRTIVSWKSNSQRYSASDKSQKAEVTSYFTVKMSHSGSVLCWFHIWFFMLYFRKPCYDGFSKNLEIQKSIFMFLGGTQA